MFGLLCFFGCLFVAIKFLSWLASDFKEQFPDNAGRDSNELDSLLSRESNNDSGLRSISPHVKQMVLELWKLFPDRKLIDVLAAIEVSISIHMAKADGQISQNEINEIREDVIERYGNNVDHKLIAEASSIVKTHISNFNVNQLAFSAYVIFEMWAKVVKDHLELTDEKFVSLILPVVSIIYRTALADGEIAHQEQKFFDKLCDLMHFSPDQREYLVRMAVYQHNTNINIRKNRGDEINLFNEALKLFKLNENYTAKELDSAWRDFVKYNHPDKFHNSSESFYNTVNANFVDGKKAYELLKTYIKEARPVKHEEKQHAAPSHEETVHKTAENTEKKTGGVNVPPDSTSLDDWSPTDFITLYFDLLKNMVVIIASKTWILFKSLGMKFRDICKYITAENMRKNIKKYRTKAIVSACGIILVISALIGFNIFRSYHYEKMLSSSNSDNIKKATDYYTENGQKSIEILTGILTSSSDELKKANSLCIILQMNGTVKDPDAYLDSFLHSSNPIVVQKSLTTIGLFPGRKTYISDSIVPLLLHSDEGVSSGASFALRRIGAGCVQTKERNFEIIYKGFDSNNPDVREFCIDSAVSFHQYSKIIIPDLVNKLADESIKVELAAVNGLGTIFPNQDDIVSWLKTNQDSKFYSALNICLQKKDHQTNRVLLGLFNRNPEFYNSDKIDVSSLLSLVTEEDSVKSLIEFFCENKCNSQAVMNFAYLYYDAFESRLNPVIINYCKANTTLLSDIVKWKAAKESRDECAKATNILYSCNDNNEEYREAAKALLDSGKIDKLHVAKLKEIIMAN